MAMNYFALFSPIQSNVQIPNHLRILLNAAYIHNHYMVYLIKNHTHHNNWLILLKIQFLQEIHAVNNL